jgi:hypothetical protein
MASIVARNKLLQEQLGVLNQGKGEPQTLSEKIAWDVQQRSAKASPFATGEWQGSTIPDPEEADKPMDDGDLPMPIRGGGDRDAAGGWFNKEYIHYVDDPVLVRRSACRVAPAGDLVQGWQDIEAAMAPMYTSGHTPLHPGQEAGQAASARDPPHFNHCGICPLLGLPQGTNISPGTWSLLTMHDTISQDLPATNPSPCMPTRITPCPYRIETANQNLAARRYNNVRFGSLRLHRDRCDKPIYLSISEGGRQWWTIR